MLALISTLIKEEQRNIKVPHMIDLSPMGCTPDGLPLALSGWN